MVVDCGGHVCVPTSGYVSPGLAVDLDAVRLFARWPYAAFFDFANIHDGRDFFTPPYEIAWASPRTREAAWNGNMVPFSTVSVAEKLT